MLTPNAEAAVCVLSHGPAPRGCVTCGITHAASAHLRQSSAEAARVHLAELSVYLHHSTAQHSTSQHSTAHACITHSVMHTHILYLHILYMHSLSISAVALPPMNGSTHSSLLRLRSGVRGMVHRLPRHAPFFEVMTGPWPGEVCHWHARIGRHARLER